jgi:class 3 adenylate cyclase
VRYLTGENVQRRLTAILAADVAGYSRLMGTDQAIGIQDDCNFGFEALE